MYTQGKMLRSASRALLKASHNLRGPYVVAVRGVRARPAVIRHRPPHEPTSTCTSTTQIQAKDLDEALEDLNGKGGIEVELDPTLLLLDHMNMARPGTKTDKRYQKQKRMIKRLTSETEKTQSLFTFFLREAHKEICHYPIKDEMEVDDLKIRNTDLVRGLEYELKLRTLNEWNVSNERYRRFQVLITVLENLHRRQDGAMILPVEQMASCFELAQYVRDDELKLRARYLSGSLIYRLKKVEFDCVNESQYIEALMHYGEHSEARRILLKNAEKVDQRWWYELLIMNYIDVRNFNEAEKVVNLIRQKYGALMDERVYLQFITMYLTSGNVERIQFWTSQFKAFIEVMGFMTHVRVEPGLGASEEDTLEYLDRIDPPSRESFLHVISSYLGVDPKGEMGVLRESTAPLIDFYLSQPGSSADQLQELLLNYKFEFKTKVEPVLRNLSDQNAEKQITRFFEDYREEHKLSSRQAEVLDEFLKSLSQVGGFERIISEMKKLTDDQQRLTQKNMYSLISALINGGKMEEAFTVLQNLEQSYTEVFQNPDVMEELVIPPVSAHHYMPFLRYYGRTGNTDSLLRVIQRFELTVGQYNPLILTQILSSLDRNKQFDLAIQYINRVLMEDIHKNNQYYTDFRQLYSAMWKCLRHIYAPFHSADGIQVYPDLRVVFMKMIHDKVVPSPTGYSTIIKTFTLSRDWHAVVCVLQYMGFIHKCTPTPQCLKLIEKVYSDRKVHQEDSAQRNAIYSEIRDRLRAESHQQRTLDPFSPQRDLLEEEEIIEEMNSLQTEPMGLEHELLWKIALAKMIEMIEVGTFDPEMMSDAHREFELSMQLDELLGPIKV
jgi:hypothetical protein